MSKYEKPCIKNCLYAWVTATATAAVEPPKSILF
jgi:hypothetical protein